MRFLVAAAVMTMTSTPAIAAELEASSRAIPPMEEQATEPTEEHEALARELVAGIAKKVGSDMIAQIPAPKAGREDEDRQHLCIAQAVYYESKGEPVRGQRAVADVIINRTKRPGFASTPCGVIRQPHQFTNASRWKIPSAADPLWQKAKEIARNAMDGIGSVSSVITHFHASRIRPGWNMRRVAAIGGHIFY